MATQSVREPAVAETCGGEVDEVEVGGEGCEDRGEVGGEVGGLTLALGLFVFVFEILISFSFFLPPA